MSRTKRESGYRKLETWQKQKSGQVFEVIVYYTTDKEEDREFLAVCKDSDCLFRISSTDLGELEEEVDQRIAEAAGLVWEKKLYIAVRGSNHRTNYNFDEGGSLTLEIAYIMTAQRRDGTTVHKYYRQNPDICSGLPKTSMFASGYVHGGRPDVMGTIIDDTPENRAALKNILDAIATLNERLQMLLSPEQVNSSLATIATGMMKALPSKVQRVS